MAACLLSAAAQAQDITLTWTKIDANNNWLAWEGRSQDYTVKLTSLPSADVTVTISEGSPCPHSGAWTIDTDLDTGGDQNTLTFTTSNWSTAQTVRLTAPTDSDKDDALCAIQHSGSGGGYDSVSKTNFVIVEEFDGSVHGSFLAQTVNGPEGRKGEYTVYLTEEPTGDVTVTITYKSGDTDISVDTDLDTTGNQNTLTITTTNYANQAIHKVTIRSEEDGDTERGKAVFTHTATGGGYTESVGKRVIDVSLWEVDDDDPPSKPTNLSATGGDASAALSWTAALGAEPLTYSKWQYRYKTTGGYGSWTDMTDSDKDTTSYTVTGLTNGTQHTFEVRAYNDVAGEASNEATATPKAPLSFGSATIADYSFAQNAAITAITLPAATGGDPSYTYSLSPSPPTGLTFTASSRQLTGTPTTLTASQTHTYTVTDSATKTASLSFRIAVEADSTPSVGAVANQTYVQNAAISTLTLPEATGGNFPIAYSISPTLPSGLSFDASNREITGTPSGTQQATSYTYTATDFDGDLGTQSFTIAIEADTDPSFGQNTVADQTWTQNTAITALTLPAATGGNGTITYTLARTTGTPALPPGVSFNATTHALSGTPTTLQSAIGYTYTATDADGDTATLTFNITIEADSTPSLGTVSDQSFHQNSAITNLVLAAATSGNAPLTYSLARTTGTPALPPGLSFDAATRTLSGTPTGTQDATEYTYTVTDGDGDTDSETFDITVTQDNSPSFGSGSVADQTWAQNAAITSLTLPAATGGDGTLAYTLARTTGTPALPPGVSFAAATRVLSGTPTTLQSDVGYTYTVTDGDGDTATLTFEITVETDTTPSLGSVSDQTYQQDSAITDLVLPAATGGNAPLTYTLARTTGTPALPPGLSFTAATRTLSGTPTGSQSAVGYTYTVTDGDGDTDTATFDITVTQDSQPSFGSSTVDDQTWTQNAAITNLTLPAATGGDGTLAYTLARTTGTPALPPGVSFAAATRVLSGTPTTLQSDVGYTYTATDGDGDAVTLTFEISIEADTSPSLGSVSDQSFHQNSAITNLVLPAATGGNATLTYTLARTTGTPALPPGLSFDAATRTLSGTPTGTQDATEYTYTVTDGDGDTDSETFDITVTADNQPSFGSSTVDDRTWTQNAAITSLTLPAATGGDGTLAYTLARTTGTPALPPGVSFAAATRVLSGTPTTLQSDVGYTYTVTDGDGDTATLTFEITVEADTSPSLGTVSDQSYHQNSAITNLVLPAATDGNAPLTYSLARTTGTPALPPGLSFDAATRTLSGTPTGTQGATGYTYTVTDGDGDTDSETFDITVTADNQPSFGANEVADQTWTRNAAITSLTLPAATGGDGTLAYTLARTTGTPALPPGVSFAAATRVLSGTPTTLQSDVGYTYTVTDGDGDTATLTFEITVEADTSPSLGTVSDQSYHQNSAITNLVLPAATDGNAPLTYSLARTTGTPALPPGLSFDAATRTLSGTPTGTQGATGYTYTVTDGDGDTDSETFDITVTADNQPSFGANEVADQTWTRNAAITSLTLPAATGGDGTLTYTLTRTTGTPALPPGVSFAAATRTLSGTPTTLQSDVGYTYTVADGDGDTATLIFEITVETDTTPSLGSVADQSFHQDSAITNLVLPAATGGNAPLTYTLARTTGTPALPPGLSFDAATRTLSGTPTGTQDATEYTYTVTDGDGDTDSETFDITVTQDNSPSFANDASIADRVYVKDTAITTETFPAATGGDTPLTYSLSPEPPTGISFTASSRQLSGTPTVLKAETAYTYTVTDGDGDTATLTFDLTVEADTQPSLGSVSDQTYHQDSAITTLTLPAATGGNAPLTYTLSKTSGSPSLPPGLTFAASTRQLSGTPTGHQTAAGYTYTVTDANGDTATATFDITVTQDNAPSFANDASIADRVYVKDTAITTETFPAATGGDTPLTYSLSPEPPTGISFTASSRQLSGTPTVLKAETAYTYTVTDGDGDTATLTFDLTVEADTQPSLGSVSDQTYHQDSAITTLTLPAATGGNAPLTYTLSKTSGSPSLPPGLTFAASTRQLSGTPTGHQTAAGYTYTVTDANGDTATATFDITVTQDNAPSFANDASIADRVYVKDTAITTETFPAATGGDTPLTYSLSPEPPTGLSFTASSRQLSGTPTALKAETAYTYTVTDKDGDTATLTFDLTVEADTQPTLGSVSDQTYHQDSAITTLTLPAATGGNAPLTYTLSKTSGSPSLPPGLTFAASTRQLSGTPTGHQTAAGYTYTVTDANGDTATATFDITVTQDNAPSFANDASIADRVYVKDTAITTETFPAATGGDTPLTYSLSPEPPTGLSFTASSRQLSGTPTALKAETAYTYTVTDKDGDTATLTFDLTVEADTQPTLGSVSDQTYHQDSAITTLTLPAATGGNAPLTYTLSKTSGSPSLPPGLTFAASTRQLSGTPTGHQTATEYTYTVTDANGDTATATFDITVTQDNAPSFANDASIADRVYVKDTAITTETFPAATGGDTPLTYSLSPEPPTGISFTASSRQLSGTPTVLKAETAYTYTVTDKDGDTATLTFDLTVEADTQPTLGSVSDQTYHQDSAITTLTLPAATGGNAPLTYTLSKTSGSPSLPPGLTFAASTRQLSGTPTGHQTAAGYTYTVTDANGDTATATFDITVTQDNAPSFANDASIADRVYVKDTAITTETFPAATGGDTPLTYSLSPEPPTGISFTASSRQLSGTPTVLKAETAYTYTVTDGDGDTATLTFDLTVEADTQPSLGSVSDQTYHQDSAITTLTLPAATGGNAPLTYTLSKTSGSPSLPPGLTFAASTRQLSGTPTGHQTATEYTYTVTDANGDTATATFDITVTQDSSPSFGSSTVADQTWTQSAAITNLTLPAATGGDGTITYTLARTSGTPSLPPGVSFNATSRVLSGTPTTLQSDVGYTYTATDGDGDAATLTFEITVEADTSPSLGAVADQTFHQNSAISALTLPAATGGNGSIAYTLARTTGTPALPPGLSFDASTRTLSGTPTGTQAAVEYTYTATDAEDDDATATFDITVTADSQPSFGSSTVDDQTWTQNVAITSLTLPAATGGDGTITYTLARTSGTPALPPGMSFNASTRVLSGTPTTLQSDVGYTYTATDGDGDAVSLTFEITVEADTTPSLGSVSDRSFHQDSAITALTLPAATSGNAPLTYALAKTTGTPALPPGLSFDAATRTLSGTPTGTQDATEYTYTVTDGDGDTDTETFDITVTQDNQPSFGANEVSDQTWTRNIAITNVTLPTATGGDGTLTYTLARTSGTPALPPGVSFAAATRVLSGTPTTLQSAIGYTYTATDGDGDAVTLSFEITVEADTTPSLGSVSDQSFHQNSAITALVLPAATSGNAPLTYALAKTTGTPALPPGLSFDAATRTLSGTPTGTQGATEYTYTVTDGDGDTDSETFDITVTADNQPTFGANEVADQTWTRNIAITSLTLPAATGGDGTVTYTLARTSGTPTLPPGVSFAAATRVLSGTPTTLQSDVGYTYTATDGDGDTATLTFEITVEADTTPTLGSVSDQTYHQNSAITNLVLPAATGGNAPLTYALARTSGTPALPPGLSFDAATRTLSGTPTGTQAAVSYTYTVTDGDSDTDSETFDITVTADNQPTFGSSTVADQTWTRNVAITSLVLPAATGGDGTVTYTLARTSGTPSLPPGVSFNSSTRTLSGTPTTLQSGVGYTYTATDGDGDAVTLTFDITVEADTTPSLGSISDRSFHQDSAITALTLPAATSGNAPLTYALAKTTGTPALPPGLSFDAATRTLSGTPTGTQGATEYTYTVTDRDGDTDTETFDITVTADNQPSFGANEVADQTWTRNLAITSLTLPAATGGDGAITYTLARTSGTPALPPGVSFNASSRLLSGTPTALQSDIGYTYTATDGDGDTATLTFEITVEADTSPTLGSVSDRSFHQNSAITALTLPAATGGNAPLTYALAKTTGTPALPPGLSFDAATRTLSGTPSSTQDATEYTYTVTDGDGDTDTATFDIAVTADDQPSFGSSTVADQTWTRNIAIASMTLPAATGGDGTITYTLARTSGTPSLPPGVSFAAATRVLSGTPTTLQSDVGYTYTATDGDGDTATLTFEITVEADTTPSLGTVSDQSFHQNSAITALVLPAATGGNAPLAYSLAKTTGTPALPPGLSFDAATRTLSGTPTGTQGATEYTYTVTDGDGDTDSETFDITVTADNQPSFASSTVADQTWTQNIAIASLTLPAATGGDGTIAYTLARTSGTPALPPGVSFNDTTRVLSGTPTTLQSAVGYTYTATDGDGDTATLTFDITVEADTTPTLGSVSDQSFHQNSAITDLVLPAATGGNASLTYALARTTGTPALPPGLSFDAATRTLSGTPTGTQAGVGYTYTATDGDGDTDTETFDITVTADNQPSFGASTVSDQTWTQDIAITSLTLPAATGGDGTLTYTLARTSGTPALPPNVSFAAATRTLSGTPTTLQSAIGYTYTATDGDGDAVTLTFDITVEADTTPSLGTVSDQSFHQDSAITALVLPAATGGNAPATYTLARTTGTPVLPPGLSFDAATRTLSGTPSGTQGAVEYTYAVTDGDGDTDSETFDITVTADNQPSLGNGTVADQTWTQNIAIASLTLPAATGGDGTIAYTLARTSGTPALPPGTSFAAATRTLSGTPTTLQNAVGYTYTATDGDGDTVSLTFDITVEADTTPSLESVADQSYQQNSAITALTLPAATGGNGLIAYTLARTSGTPALPPGLTFNAATRTLSGTPTATQSAVGYTYTATDAEGDADTAPFEITVTADGQPSFGVIDVADQTWTQNAAITSLVLPVATGGDGTITYTLARTSGTPALPPGTSFDAATRTLSGTPTTLQSEVGYTYTATDTDADTASLTFEITVEADTSPSLGAVSDQTYHQNSAITTLTLPAATGGNAPVTYTLARTSGTPALPPGLSFDAATRTLSGTPTGTQAAVGYTYTATDGEGDADTATFDITITADGQPSFGQDSIADRVYFTGNAITDETLPAAIGGDGATTYSLTPALPDGLTFNVSTRLLSGTPTAPSTQTTYTYTATDEDGDAATLTFAITVEQDTAPSLATVADQTYRESIAITPLTLPAATSGNAPLGYSLARTSGAPALPPGLAFDASTRQLTGTPEATQAAAGYTYAVTDANGDTATTTFDIAVVDNLAPSFGGAGIADRVYVEQVPITAETLPEAQGGEGGLTYSLSPALPPGLFFSTSTRELYGTPTAPAGETTYIYAATDGDGDAATLTFKLTVTADSQPLIGALADQIYHQNRAIPTLTLPAATAGNPPHDYALARTVGTPALPPGLDFDATTRELTGTPTGTQPATNYTYTATDANGDADTETFDITVIADGHPSFGDSTVADRVYVENTAIATLTLPQASGGDGDLTYALVPDPPTGLSFDAATRQISGTPTAPQPKTTYTYTVTDTDGDAVSLTFSLTVVPDTTPSLAAIPDQTYHQSREIAPLTLPAATGGNAPLTYALAVTTGSPPLPPGLSFDATTRTLSGTPTGFQAATGYTYTATDANGDTATATFDITVTPDGSPTFRDGSIADQVYVENAAIARLTLPEASGGNGGLTYALAPELPTGLSFDAATRQISGTPTAPQAKTTYTYTATDTDGDAASLTFALTVQPDHVPDFEAVAVDDQFYYQDTAIEALTLPAASGGNAPLIYSLSPAPPPGLQFEAATMRLSGTPTETRDATNHTYTATDRDGSTASIEFEITVWPAKEIDIADPEQESVPVEPVATVREGSTAVYELALTSPPSGEVTVTLTSSDPSVTVSPSVVVFTPDNYAVAVPLTLTSTADADGMDLDVSVTVTASGGGYDGVVQTLSVTVDDDDRGLLLTPGSLSLDEGGAVATYRVALAAEPGGVVTVEVASDDPGAATATPSTLTFTAGDYAQEQTVTVTPADDADGEDESLNIVHAPSGGDYGGRERATLAITVADDDAKAIELSEEALPVAEGSTASYTVRLATEPTEPVTVTITGSGDDDLTCDTDPAVEGDQNTLTFTGADWGRARTVTVSATHDDDGTDGTGVLQHAAAGGGYSGLTAELSIAEVDDDPLGLVFSPGSVSVREGAAATYAVSLATRPAGPVKVAVSAEDATLSVAPSTLTFEVGTYDVAQQVTVTVAEDDTDADRSTSIDHAASGGGYGGIAGSVAVDVEAELHPVFGDDARIPDQRYIAHRPIASLTLPEASGGNGRLTYALTPAPPEGLLFDAESRTLRGTPSSPMASTRYTYTASDSDADPDLASLAFNIVVDAAGDEATADALAAQGRAILNSATDVIGQRFRDDAAAPAPTAVAALSGLIRSMARPQAQPIPATGAAAASGGGGWERDTDIWPVDDFGLGGAWNVAGAPDHMAANVARGTATTVMPGGYFAARAGRAGRWTLWAARDEQSFDGYSNWGNRDGRLRSTYLGADRRGDGWLAGAAVSAMRGGTDYVTNSGAGRLDTDLDAVFPYLGAELAGGLRLWMLAGYGSGAADVYLRGRDLRESRDLTMRLGAVGGRRSIAAWRRFELSLVGDAGALRLSTTGHPGLIGALTVGVEHARLAVDLSRSGPWLSSFLQLGGRYDDGDDHTGTGVEVVAGTSRETRRVDVEARIRWLTMSEPAYEEYGAMFRVQLKAQPDGTGWRLALAPQWGVLPPAGLLGGEDPSDRALNDFLSPTAASAAGLRFDSALGYGLLSPRLRGTLVPTATVSSGSHGRTLGLGLSYQSLRTLLGRDVALDFTAGRVLTPAVGGDLDLRLRFSIAPWPGEQRAAQPRPTTADAGAAPASPPLLPPLHPPTTSVEPATPREALRPETALLGLPADHFAVQLMALSSEAAADDYLARHGVEGSRRVRIEHGGRTLHAVLLGVYPDAQTAQRAADVWSPPPGVQPWVRSLGPLQAAMTRVAD